MSEESVSERPVTDTRRRANAPLLRLQSRQEEIRFACLKGDLSSLETLIRGNVESINDLLEDGWSPLMIAVNGANPAVVKFLLLQGADPNKCRPDGFSPLLAALTSSKSLVLVQQCVQILVDAGADVNCRSENGLTPLLLAVKDNRVPVVDLLVFHGADLNAMDNSGRTASELAKERKYNQILLTLQNREIQHPNPELVKVGSHNSSTKERTTLKELSEVSATDIASKIRGGDNNIMEPAIHGYDNSMEPTNTSILNVVQDKYPNEIVQPISPQQIKREIQETLEMVKKDNMLSDIESNQPSPPLHSDHSQDVFKNGTKCQPTKDIEPEHHISTSHSYSNVPNDNREKGCPPIFKFGFAFGFIASLVGMYYARIYLQKR